MRHCLFLYNSISTFSRKKVYGGETVEYRAKAYPHPHGGAARNLLWTRDVILKNRFSFARNVRKYIELLEWKGDPQMDIRLGWIITYLHHPNPQVQLKVLRDHIPSELLGTVGLVDELSQLLASFDDEVRSEVAKIVLQFNEDVLQVVFNIVFMSSGTNQALEALHKHCPKEREQLLIKLGERAFFKAFG